MSRYDAGSETIRVKDKDYSEACWKTKIGMQSTTTEKQYDQIFEEMKKLEEKKSEEALLFVQEKDDVWRYQNERDEATRLQRSGNSRRLKEEADSQDLFFFSVMQVIGGGSLRRDESGVSEKDSGRASGDE